MEEIWKDIHGYEGLYQVSNLGRVKSLKRPRVNNEKILKPIEQFGYHNAHLSNGTTKKMQIHRLVANAFICNPENKPCVNHKNGIKNDNRVENLEWCTSSENEFHSYHILLKKSPATKLSKEAIVDILKNAIKSNPPKRTGNIELFELKYNVSKNSILNVLNKKTHVF